MKVKKVMKGFGERLKELRNGEPQSSFAKKLGLSQVVYGRYELNQREPNLETLYRIGLECAVSIDWLLGLPERPNGAVTVNAPVSGAAVAVGNATATVGGDCAKCQLMIEHIRQITGRG